MPKTVSVTEAKAQLTQLLTWAHQGTNQVVVEKHGSPTAVIISIQEYTKLKKLQEKNRRESALQQLENLAKQNQSRNTDLSVPQTASLADEISRKTVSSLKQKGRVQFSK